MTNRSKTAAPDSRLRTAPRRVLVVSHSHPDLSKGGAEVAAHQLFRTLKGSPDHEAWYLGCVRDAGNAKLGASLSQPYSDHEYLYACQGFDWFKFANLDAEFPNEFRALLNDLKPDVVHFHHYLNVGVEAFLHVRETLPEAQIVLTLHEYLGICHHYGQMVTRPARSLCSEASPLRCSRCFNEFSPSDFFMRDMYIKRFFDVVDQFIAPSEFLAERYVTWGLPREKMTVLENVLPVPTSTAPVARTASKGPLRVGFFGQISVLKGINVLFEAAEILEEQEQYGVVFEIYGDHSGQPPEFQQDFLTRLAKVGRNVKFMGPYEQSRVDALMRSVDLVLVPSVWWENSPVVIQEAIRNRRPVICSDIGGMAEKVRDGLDGMHFPVGNSVALAHLLSQLVEDRTVLGALGDSIRPAVDTAMLTNEFKRLYQAPGSELSSRRTAKAQS